MQWQQIELVSNRMIENENEKNVDNGKYYSNNNFGYIKKLNELNRRNRFCPKIKNKLTFFSVIAKKPVDIVFGRKK